MQCITTIYRPPTNNKGARIVAKCNAGQIVTSWKCDLNVNDNHVAAAKSLCEMMGWDDKFVTGFDVNNHGQHVFT